MTCSVPRDVVARDFFCPTLFDLVESGPRFEVSCCVRDAEHLGSVYEGLCRQRMPAAASL